MLRRDAVEPSIPVKLSASPALTVMPPDIWSCPPADTVVPVLVLPRPVALVMRSVALVPTMVVPS